MQRRYFDHVYKEICVAADRRFSRYDLWLVMCENGIDPNTLTRMQARHFVEESLGRLLKEQEIDLGRRAQCRLERRILQFDPDHPTPEEWMLSLFETAEEAA